ncbi:HIT family protein [Candidatus Gracilibacteria bacterium]|nr:HIT family protein [Candidatus Gracilibacteria bacterium]
MSGIFGKIIAGEIPSYKVHEDKNTFAFLDIHPKQKGHLLVVPKIEINHFEDMDDDLYSSVFFVVKN